MAQIISSTGVTVEFESRESVVLGKAAIAYVKQLYEHPLSSEEAEEVKVLLTIMHKIGLIAQSEAGEIQGRLN